MCGILVRCEGPGDPVSESPISYVVNLHDERSKRLLLQLRAVLESDCLDILVVTETLLTEDSEIIDNTYRIFRRDQNRQRGGVMLLTRSNIPAIQRHDLDSNC